MKLLLYKGIIFDEWVKYKEDGQIVCYVTVCKKHAEQYKKILKSELDDFGSGNCSICGCDCANDSESLEFYVNLDPSMIQILNINVRDVSKELEYRENSYMKWDEDLYDFTTEELQAIEAVASLNKVFKQMLKIERGNT